MERLGVRRGLEGLLWELTEGHAEALSLPAGFCRPMRILVNHLMMEEKVCCRLSSRVVVAHI